MERKQTGIIATIVATLLCGCPGLFSLCLGALTASAAYFPGAEIDIFGSDSPQAALNTGLIALCVGLLLVAIPVLVGFLTLRKRPAAAPASPDEPLPPPR